MTSPNDDALQNAIRNERCLLQCLLENHDLIKRVDCDLAPRFFDSGYRSIFRAILKLHGEGAAPDSALIAGEPGVDVAVLADLLTGCAVAANFEVYVKRILELDKERQFRRSLEELGTGSMEDRPRILEQMTELLKGDVTSQDWRALFHSYVDVINAPPARFVIDGFLQADGITVVGALAGHGKTLSLLAIVRALLEGGKLFHHFQVTAKSERVIYLIPEAGLGPFSARLKTFHLQEHIQAGRLFCRTLSAQGQLALTDPRLLEAVQGADVFLDTAIRFMDGAEDAENSRVFADTLFGLQRAGARTITGAHHSPKSFGKDNFMTLENVLRGSGDIGAMVATCWGLSQVDAASNRIYVANVKARDFAACEPFIIEGRPSIDQTGYFEMTHPPGFAGDLSDHKVDRKAGRPETQGKGEKQAEARKLRDEGMSYRDIADALDVKVPTLHRWLKESL